LAQTAGIEQVPADASATQRFTSDEERATRLAALRKMMEAEGFDALVICGRDDIRYRGRTFYVTDVWQLLADTHVVLFPDGLPIFVGGQVFGLEQAETSDWATEFRVSGTPGTEIAKVLSEHGSAKGNIGVVGLSDASFAHGHYLELAEGAPDATLLDATRQFEDVRQSNSPEGLRRLRETSAIFREVYTEIEPYIKPGITELQLAAQAHRVAREYGLRDPMVLMQVTPYGPLSFGTTREIQPDDIVTLWLESAGPSGFWLEYRQCYSFGAPPEEHARAWKVQREAVEAGLAACKAGEPAYIFAETVKKILNEQAGWDIGYHGDPCDQHNMFSLHGIGTDAIQGVWVPGRDRMLREDEVVNIHPTTEFKTEDEARKFGWLGITDNILIKPEGAEFLTHDKDVSRGFIEL
jgi:Xaa-Pro aminopeptidase